MITTINSSTKSVEATWLGQIQLVSGPPPHSQSQGLIEQAHYTLERIMSAKISDSVAEHPLWVDWSHALPVIMYRAIIIQSFAPKSRLLLNPHSIIGAWI